MATRAFDVVVFDLDGTLVDTAPRPGGGARPRAGRPGASDGRARHGPSPGRRRHTCAFAARARTDRRRDGGARRAGRAALPRALCCPYFRQVDACRTCRTCAQCDGQGRDRSRHLHQQARAARAKLVERLKWQARFASIVGGDTTEASKPDPRPLRRCIDACGGGSAVFVGDSRIDRATARAAGVPFVAAVTGFFSDTFACGEADAVITSFAELIPTLGRLA